MGQILHPSASTTPSTRRKIQNSKESITQLAKKYGIARNTVWKWKKRNFVHDAPRGINRRHSTVLSRQEEALIVAFRKHTLLPLDDCLYSLKKIIPRLNRSNIYRCFKRHGIQKLPNEFIQNYWTNHPEKFKIKPSHLNMKPYTYLASPKGEGFQPSPRETLKFAALII